MVGLHGPATARKSLFNGARLEPEIIPHWHSTPALSGLFP